VTQSGWQVIVPVKRTVQGKSRLAAYAGELRAELAHAIALDTIAAALAAPAVVRLVVVTDDERVREEATGLGAFVVADAGGGLNAALRHGADAAEALDQRTGLAALQGDLPSLRAADLAAALELASRYDRAFVADAETTGTTLLTASSRAGFEPAFGDGSSRAHRQRGFVELDAPTRGTGDDDGWRSLRRDVDTDESLRAAALIGLGERSRRVLEQLTSRP
jgi:2-phospho-L-lactate guanylyltransferase